MTHFTVDNLLFLVFQIFSNFFASFSPASKSVLPGNEMANDFIAEKWSQIIISPFRVFLFCSPLYHFRVALWKGPPFQLTQKNINKCCCHPNCVRVVNCLGHFPQSAKHTDTQGHTRGRQAFSYKLLSHLFSAHFAMKNTKSHKFVG